MQNADLEDEVNACEEYFNEYNDDWFGDSFDGTDYWKLVRSVKIMKRMSKIKSSGEEQVLVSMDAVDNEYWGLALLPFCTHVWFSFICTHFLDAHN